MVKSKVPMNSCGEKGHHHRHQREPHAGAAPSALATPLLPSPPNPSRN